MAERPDRTRIEGARFAAYLGVTEEERARPQEIRLDLCWISDQRLAARSDALSDTIDYMAVWQQVAQRIAARPYKLVESLAEAIAQELLDTFPMAELELRLVKPGALREQRVEAIAIEIQRSRAP